MAISVISGLLKYLRELRVLRGDVIYTTTKRVFNHEVRERHEMESVNYLTGIKRFVL